MFSFFSIFFPYYRQKHLSYICQNSSLGKILQHGIAWSKDMNVFAAFTKYYFISLKRRYADLKCCLLRIFNLNFTLTPGNIKWLSSNHILGYQQEHLSFIKLSLNSLISPLQFSLKAKSITATVVFELIIAFIQSYVKMQRNTLKEAEETNALCIWMIIFPDFLL